MTDVASLTVLSGPLAGTRLVIEDSVDEILVGSDPDCRMVLDTPGVSPIHARLWLDLGGLTAYDTHSPRGLFVNDDRVVDQAAVRDGDVLWLGPPGDESSVMIQCHVPQPLAAAAPLAAEEEAAGGATPEDVAFAEPAPVAEPAVALEDALFVDEPEPSAAEPEPEPMAAPPEPEIAAAPAAAQAPALIDPWAGHVPEAPAPPPSSAPEAMGDGLEDFFVEPPPAPSPEPADAGGAAIDFITDELLAPAPAQAPPPAAAPAAPAAPAFAGQDAEFFVDEPPAAAAAADASPIPLAAVDEAFELEEPGAVPPPAPVRVEPPPVAAPAVTPLPPPVPGTPSPVAPPAAVIAAAPAPRAPMPAATSIASGPGVIQPPPRAPRPPRQAADAGAPAHAPAAPSRRPAAAVPAARRPPVALIAGGAAVLLLVAVGAFLLFGGAKAPKVASVQPARASAGQTITISGANFGPTAGENMVTVGGQPARVIEAATDRLSVEVPDLPTTPGTDVPAPVRVSVGGRESEPASLAVYRAPRLQALRPEVAMPGETVTLTGTGWGTGATVRFGGTEAQVTRASAAELSVVVPALTGAPGTEVPVTVSMGAEPSNVLPFVVGHLPLVTGAEPRSAAPGEVVTIGGRGFAPTPADNTVRIGGVPALVASATARELKVVVPRAPAGDTSVEVRVPGSDTPGQAPLTVGMMSDPIDLRFYAEPYEDQPGHDHAAIATGLGPVFILSGAGGQSAARRAVEAQTRLNEAAQVLRASVDADLRAIGLDATPALVLTGREGAPLVEVLPDDAAGYDEDWTGLKGRGGPVTPARLALWWEAVARDLVLVLSRGDKPQHAAALAAEGRVLAEIQQAARREAGAGVPAHLVAEARPAQRAALRLLGLRVPASVVAPEGAGGEPAGPAPARLQLQGSWEGQETEGGLQKLITIVFSGPGGTYRREGTLAISLPLHAVEQPSRSAIRFQVQAGGGTRYYRATWDGTKLSGTVATDAAGQQAVGTFELMPTR